METLIRKRATIKSNLTRLEKGLEEIDRRDKVKLKNRLQTLETYWTSFEGIQTAIEEAQTDDRGIQAQEGERAEFERRYFSLKDSISEDVEGEHQGGPRPQIHPPGHLPSLNLPTFAGNYSEWNSFLDLFNAMVTNHAGLSGAEKLRYLKMCLKEPARRTIASLEPTDANFNVAIQLLTDRYCNKRLAITNHYETLIHYPRLTYESGTELRKLFDTFQENIRALEVLHGDTWETIMIHLLQERMDPGSRKEFEMTLAAQQVPEMKDLCRYIEQKCRALSTHPSNGDNRTQHRVMDTRTPSQTQQSRCPICPNTHPIFRCPTFKEMTPTNRASAIKKKKICTNCFSSKHSVTECQASNCRQCGRKHNTLLHFSREATTSPSGSNLNPRAEPFNATSIQNAQATVLATAVIQVKTEQQEWSDVRTFIDGGSQANFISERLAHRLGCRIRPAKMNISGLSTTKVAQIKGVTRLQIRSRVTDYKIDIDVAVIKSIATLPQADIEPLSHPVIKSIPFADPKYHQAAPVDLLLGVNIAFNLWITRKGPEETYPNYLHKSQFGWVVAGSIPTSAETQSLPSGNFMTLDSQLRRFWEMEECPGTKTLSLEERFCEEHFTENHQRLDSGRFQVRIPFKGDPEDLGESRPMALARFLNLERKFERDPQLKSEYKACIGEYIDLGHMVETKTKPSKGINYLPHHAVFKNDNEKRKIRVVFDASAKTSTNLSLNDIMATGPTIQPTMFSILLRFRLRAIPMAADIEKMYRQIRLHEDDQKYHHIIWREDCTRPLKEFTLTTVTFGTTAAPFLAVRTLHELANNEEETHPRTSKILKNNFYVDDLATSLDSPEEAFQIRQELTSLLKKGGFHLTKWRSTNQRLNEVEANETSLLGYNWSRVKDQLSIKRVQSTLVDPPTKRSVLATMASIFDPIGLLTPVVLQFKILIQDIWLEKSNWDAPLGQPLLSKWRNLITDLQGITEIKIPRHLGLTAGTTSTQLHGFCDASTKAFGAVVYLRCITQDSIKITLIAAKSRVAPLKTISLPRLELCGALLLSRLIQEIQQAIQIQIERTTCWIDSSIALAWIQSSPHRWATFIANRVTAIQNLIPPEYWRFIRGRENPADIASRGGPASELKDLWWHGPPWLQTEPCEPEIEHVTDQEKKTKGTQSFVTLIPIQVEFADKYSSVTTLIRVTAYVLRFISQSRRQTNHKEIRLDSSEIEDALRLLIKAAQNQIYTKEIIAIKKGTIDPRNQLRSLNPYIDSEGLLRVNGRLVNSDLPHEAKYPIILPPNHRLTISILKQEHLKHFHAQTNLMMSIMRSKYWIPRLRSVIKTIIHECIPCIRQRAEGMTPLMAPLPPGWIISAPSCDG